MDWFTHMRRGEFEAAWRISDALLNEPRDFTLPRHFQRIWTGEPLHDKRVLIRCYHGLGDTVQFLRYVPLVREIAAEVVVWVQRALVPLVPQFTVFPYDVGDVEDPGDRYDVDVEIMELAHVFRRVIADVPYLHVDALPGVAGGIGFAWKSGDWDSSRDVPFVRLPGVTHNLQRDEDAPGMINLPERNDPLGTARLMKALDLVITVDTFTAHLAGALGVETWVMLPENADWRWMENRTDSPWYPTMRLFRGANALEDVTRALRRRGGLAGSSRTSASEVRRG